jgi:predicted secreted protein
VRTALQNRPIALAEPFSRVTGCAGLAHERLIEVRRMRWLNEISARLHGKPAWRDGRSRTIVLVPHCALNQNARAPGAAERPAAVVELVTGLLDRDVGILQMPCPELCVFGLDRAQVQVESELRTVSGKAWSRNLARSLIEQIVMYRDCGIHVLGIFGKNGSPSCGVEETWEKGLRPGTGAFIEELAAELKEQGVVIEIAGIRDSEPDKALAIVDRWISALK